MLGMRLGTVLCARWRYLYIMILRLSPFLCIVCCSGTISLPFTMLLLPGLLGRHLFPRRLLSGTLLTLMASYCLYRLIDLAQDTAFPWLITCSNMMTIGEQAGNGGGRAGT